eukprot:TRINITY_DN10299_c0_g1_i1.p1 TRINITY_DN10299_c0_g1~~TRINITY_DN10299_c0_g1_i1.p1  ORF type:complete len:677 (+),score=86.26 TRINITY_DN10299_c0_g1_i1:30-2033(+)
MKKRVLLKIILLGDSGVGKSSITQQYVNCQFTNEYKATIGADFLSKSLEIDGQPITLQIWDTAGQERFSALGTAFYRGADCCILVCDLTNLSSLTNLELWLDEFRVHAPGSSVTIVGNKADLVQERKVTPQMLRQWATRSGIDLVFETSAKDGAGLASAFAAIAAEAVKTHQTDAYVPDSLCICAAPKSSAFLALSVGGARDAGTFRQCLRNRQLPKPNSITYEGVFAEYAFDTHSEGARPKSSGKAPLFQPTYRFARSTNPLTKETEFFVAIGLNSTLDASTWQRRSLCLVVLLDISGSMADFLVDCRRNSKLDLAKQSIYEIARRLRLEKNDRIGIATFAGHAQCIMQVTRVDANTPNQVQLVCASLSPDGSTNMEHGITEATKMIAQTWNADPPEFRPQCEYRIIVITDDQPNQGHTTALVTPLRRNAENCIHISFLGVGVDFEPKLVGELTTVPGANYFSVQSAKLLRKRLVEEFDCLVNPLVFDVKVFLDSNSTEVDTVYGTPNHQLTQNTFFYIATLFPTKTTDAGSKGGIILAKLKVSDPNCAEPLGITASWRDLEGTKEHCVHTVLPPWSTQRGDFFADSSIRKGIALARYVTELQDWLKCTTFLVAPTGEKAERLQTILRYLDSERRVVKDNAIKQELQVLEDILRPGLRRPFLRFCS